MIRNFFTVALRNLFKHKVFSFINIFGLALGIAASLLIVQYARFELSYDHFEPGAGQIYRLQLDRYNNGKLSTRWAAGATGLGPAVKDAFPEVESFARLRSNSAVVSYKTMNSGRQKYTPPPTTFSACSGIERWPAPPPMRSRTSAPPSSPNPPRGNISVAK